MKETIRKLKQHKAAIKTWLAQLKVEDRQLDQAIKAMLALPVPISAQTQTVKQRKMSAAGRRAIAAAQQARWAKIRTHKAKK